MWSCSRSQAYVHWTPTNSTHKHTSAWQQTVGSVGFGSVFERERKSMLTAIWNGFFALTHVHTYTHNCTMIFTSDIEEVMALWAISLSGCALEVHSRCFRSLITEQKSHGGHTDRHSSRRHTSQDKIPRMKVFAAHIPITDTDNGL